MKPLEGIKVLDLSRVLAGPWCTQLLADLGAEVTKIERPGAGDDTRHWGPPWHGEGDERVAAYFLSCNRGKKSAAIDFAQPEGAALVRKLAEQADVVVENFKVGGLEKFGLDARALRAANPRLVYASITGFGQDGPYADRAGYDYIIQGMGGLMSITGLPDGTPGGGPMRVGVAVVDLFTGLYTCVAILSALSLYFATRRGSPPPPQDKRRLRPWTSVTSRLRDPPAWASRSSPIASARAWMRRWCSTKPKTHF